MKIIIIIFLVVAVCFADPFWPNDDAGDPFARKIGIMDGNRVRMQFANDSEVSDWGAGTDPHSHYWPNDLTGSKQTDGIAFMVGARVFVEYDSIPVPDPTDFVGTDLLDTLYFLQTNYREEMDMDPLTQTIEWGFHPVRGYTNDYIDDPPAMSNTPRTWPQEWPLQNGDTRPADSWYGRNASTEPNADLECYLVVNDAQDQEYIQQDSPVKYYPRPGHRIGEKDPKMSKQVGLPWGGVGLRVAARGMQWDMFLLRDMIFWEYEISNISDYDIPDAAVGFWVDHNIGGDGADEFCNFLPMQNLAYAWDINGVGYGALSAGTIGYAFLETPSLADSLQGITSFSTFPVPDHTPPFINWFRNDSSMWELIGTGHQSDITIGDPINFAFIFGNGPFPLEKQTTKRTSIAIMHSYDNIYHDIQNPLHLQAQKRCAQMVFEGGFTTQNLPKNTPPATSQLNAEYQNGKIKMSWNDAAEIQTQESMLNNANDFQGYKLYKQYSIDKKNQTWSDPELLFRCDLADGIYGYFQPDFYQELYDLGDDSGLTHEFVDTDIIPDMSYLYTLVAYDRGILIDEYASLQDIGLPLPPKEAKAACNAATPKYANFDGQVEIQSQSLLGSGSVTPLIYIDKLLNLGHTYVVKFGNYMIDQVRNTDTGRCFRTNQVSVYDITDGSETLVYQDNGNCQHSVLVADSVTGGFSMPATDSLLTGVFDGLILQFNNPVQEAELDMENTGWLTNSYGGEILLTGAEAHYFPWDHQIVFSEEGHTSQMPIKVSTRVKDEEGARIDRDRLFGKGTHFPCYVQNMNWTDPETGMPLHLELVGEDRPDNLGQCDGVFDILHDRIVAGYIDTRENWAGSICYIDFSELDATELPQNGDIFQIKYNRPFFETDSIVFYIDPALAVKQDSPALPTAFSVGKNYPNPFNMHTTIPYNLPKEGVVSAEIYDLLGRKVKTLFKGTRQAGFHKAQWDGKNNIEKEIGSGIYFCRIRYESSSQAEEQTIKITLIK